MGLVRGYLSWRRKVVSHVVNQYRQEASSSYPEKLAWLEASILAVEARLAISTVSCASNLSFAASHALSSSPSQQSCLRLYFKDEDGGWGEDQLTATAILFRWGFDSSVDSRSLIMLPRESLW